jgi:hypothetical protein
MIEVPDSQHPQNSGCQLTKQPRPKIHLRMQLVETGINSLNRTETYPQWKVSGVRF